ncbi:MAG: hypothetical protein K0R34_482 [Herbinix sp.]|jgi:hypothetical protein|nr:hypothetical protein [Herbinix sp.]
MKKGIQAIIIVLTTLLLFTGCNNKEDLQPVSIGNLSFEYDANVWQYNKSTDEAAPLEFEDKKGNTVSIYVSQESTYQHPLDMIQFFETMVSTNDGFEIFLKPTKIDVNGATWYEYGYNFKDGDVLRKVYQRYYGKYYNAASISYTSTDKNYDFGYDKALKMMSGIKTSDMTNDVNEAKAHEFLVGEWDVAASGYLSLKEDGTYEWYKDSSKDKSNMHYGTYGCDVENAVMSLKEGDGIYLVLFPEGLTVNGSEEEMTTYKMDYIISFDKKEEEGYQMVNMSSYTLYTLTKQ